MSFVAKILVIENDQTLVKALKNVLTTHGYDVSCAYNGAIGIQRAFESHPDLILSGIRIFPIDGYHVVKVLKENSLTDHIPFIFITGYSRLEDIRYGMDLGADDYFVKPINYDQLINSIECRLSKYNKLKQSSRFEFDTLFNLTPNGIFLSDGSSILDANPALLDFLNYNKQEIIKLKIEDLFKNTSSQIIKEKIDGRIARIHENFHDKVTILSKNGIKTNVSIFISVFEKYPGVPLMIGLIDLSDNFTHLYNDVIASEIIRILKAENISIPHSLGEKINGIFKIQNIKNTTQANYFFSNRESQVLRLSMQGLPIKIIAEKLAISDRTVEKHRANLMEKTGSCNIIAVIVYALRNKLIEI